VNFTKKGYHTLIGFATPKHFWLKNYANTGCASENGKKSPENKKWPD
jgi:hypothetical protein